MNQPDYDNDPTLVRPWANKSIWANAAGLQWLAALKPDPLVRKRCEGYPWVCPYIQRDEAPPCRKNQQKRRKSELVILAYVNWVVTIEAVGQMSLFEPGVTHKQVWRHWKSGRIMESYPKPVYFETVCKQMALAAIRWNETSGFWTPPDWRMIPLVDDPTWGEQMVEQHNLKPCWFDTL